MGVRAWWRAANVAAAVYRYRERGRVGCALATTRSAKPAPSAQRHSLSFNHVGHRRSQLLVIPDVDGAPVPRPNPYTGLSQTNFDQPSSGIRFEVAHHMLGTRVWCSHNHIDVIGPDVYS